MTHSHNSHPLRRQGTSQDTDLLRLRKAALLGEWCIQWLSHTQLGCYQTLLSCSVGITNSEWYARWKHEHIFFVISTNWTMIFWGDGWSIHFFTRNWLLCGPHKGQLCHGDSVHARFWLYEMLFKHQHLGLRYCWARLYVVFVHILYIYIYIIYIIYIYITYILYI
jgi:hypothetical protein